MTRLELRLVYLCGTNTQDPAYKEQFDAQNCACRSPMLGATELFNIVVNEILYWLYSKLFAHSSRVFIVIELIVHGT